MIEALRPIAGVLVFVAAAVYIALRPLGYWGILPPLMGVLLFVAFCNRVTIGVYLLVFGSFVAGATLELAGIPGVGGKVAGLAGLALITSRARLGHMLRTCEDGLGLLCWQTLVLVLFYLYGSMDSYATAKLANWVVVCGYNFVAYLYLCRSRETDWLRLGQLGILTGLLYLAVSTVHYPDLRPASPVSIGVIRDFLSVNRDAVFDYHVLGMYGVFGLALMLGFRANAELSKRDELAVLAYACMAMVLVAWSGARQYMVMLALVGPVTLLCPNIARRYRVYAGVCIAMLAVVLYVNLWQQFDFINEVLSPDARFSDRLNRGLTYDAAIDAIVEKPMLGEGLGGYKGHLYTPEKHGEGSYAHNLVLELLSETGVVGTALFLLPLLAVGSLRARFAALRLPCSSKAGNVVAPLFLCLLLRSMISSDLVTSSAVFAILVALVSVDQRRTVASRSESPRANCCRLPMG
ncbi:MAG TPA: O-antigen ligase family protein [Phycisphaerae bacterium]|nr:O-antigen ligase family protein [Phycisphaerae bacterium]